MKSKLLLAQIVYLVFFVSGYSCTRIPDIEEEETVFANDPFSVAYKKGCTIIYYCQYVGEISFVFSNGQVEYVSYDRVPILTIGNNNHWCVNGNNTGISISVEPFISESNGFWVINGNKTNLKADLTEISENDIYLQCIIERLNYWEFCYSNNLQFKLDKNEEGLSLLYKNSKQYNNTMAFFGGSVGYGATVCRDYWEESLNLHITNYAKGGYGFCRKDNQIREFVDEVCDNNITYDIYMFWCSTNDMGCPVGDITSYSEKDNYSEEALSTQDGGINYCIKRIYETKPDAKILVLTSLPSFNTRGYEHEALIDGRTYLFQLVKGQKDCCENWGIPYYDQFYHTVFDNSNYQLFYWDATHPNNLGYDLIKIGQAIFIATAI